MSETNDHNGKLSVPPSGGEGAGIPVDVGGGELNLRVRRIGEKLQSVLRQREILLKENGKLKEEVRLLKDHYSGNLSRLEQLQQQVEILKAAGGDMSEVEKKALEKRLSQYIREIDRCIALLGE